MVTLREHGYSGQKVRTKLNLMRVGLKIPLSLLVLSTIGYRIRQSIASAVSVRAKIHLNRHTIVMFIPGVPADEKGLQHCVVESSACPILLPSSRPAFSNFAGPAACGSDFRCVCQLHHARGRASNLRIRDAKESERMRRK